MNTVMIFLATGVGFGLLWRSNQLFFGCLIALAVMAAIKFLP